MPAPMFETADQLSPAELAAVWNAGFASYYFDVSMSEARLLEHVRRSGIALEESIVMSAGGGRIGLSLLADEETEDGRRRGWIGGFGIAAAHRGKGWARRLIGEHIARFRSAGFAEVRLEVIDYNPARRVYAEAGFAELRTLRSFAGVPDPSWAAQAMPLATLGREDLAEWHAQLHGGQMPTWRRCLPTLRRVLAEEPRAETLAVETDEGYPACALVLPGPERITILDAAAVSRDAAFELVGGLARTYPGQPFRLVDEPADGPLAEACAQYGLREVIRQVEMVWAESG